ncbi:MAG: MerR family transcriptional regulator [Lachnospiraceae bacterium]|nr:MerR family transcriptional regulator [Lachnospiraceae bacterium]
MRIGEIAEKTGLSISNIRFYEKKGLIGPGREEENKYRNYTDADLERLNLIILYRKMDFSVELIGKLLENEVSAEDALEQQLIDLKLKQQMLQSSIDLCQKMIDDQAYDEIDVEHYLDYVREEETNGRIFEKIDDFIEDFSSFTNFNRFVGGSRLGWWLFPIPWMNRAVRMIWCAFFTLVPIIGIIDDHFDGNGTSPVTLIFWGMWILFFAFSFISFRRAGRK